MPIESALLEDFATPTGIDYCPNCKAVFRPFMRGQVQRGKRWLLIGPRRPYCALICVECKEIVGHEEP